MRDKVLLISGSRGIAAATARLAAAEGASVFIASRTEKHCQALKDQVQSQGGRCEFHCADLTEADSAGRIVEQAISRFGRIDALYNVAGISGRRWGDGPLHTCTDEGWDLTMNANLKSLFWLSRAVLRQMLEQPPAKNGLRGTILNMASALVRSPDPRHFNTHAYTTSKAAIAGLSLAMAAYYARFKIRVNAIAPSLVRTDLTVRAQGSEPIMEYVRERQPLPDGMIEPEEIAQTSVFLLSDESRNITGELITVDGGWCVSG